jgi:hypothetical protein
VGAHDAASFLHGQAIAMKRFSFVLAVCCALGSGPAWARLKMDDLASLWPRASMSDKIDFTNRMGKAMVALSPDLTREYFMRCLEETANIGDTRNLTLSDMVRTCVSLQAQPSSEEP